MIGFAVSRVESVRYDSQASVYFQSCFKLHSQIVKFILVHTESQGPLPIQVFMIKWKLSTVSLVRGLRLAVLSLYRGLHRLSTLLWNEFTFPTGQSLSRPDLDIFTSVDFWLCYIITVFSFMYNHLKVRIIMFLIPWKRPIEEEVP